MHLRPTTTNDIPYIAHFTALANHNDEMSLWVCPDLHRYPADYEGLTLRLTRWKLLQPGTISFVVETDADDDGEDGGKVVGYATWGRYGDSPVARRWRAYNGNEGWSAACERTLRNVEWKFIEVMRLDRATSPARFRALKAAFASALPSEAFEEGAGSWHLHNICVDVKYQRRGLAKMLLGWGLEQARREGVPVTLESSVKGKGLYTSLGFKEVKTVSLEDGDGGRLVVPVMVWEPEDKTGQWIGRVESVERGEI